MVRLSRQQKPQFLSTPSARRATKELDAFIRLAKFLSTPSARRATCGTGASRRFPQISIHALREEGDVERSVQVCVDADFYPRPPRGGRHPR